jgi:uncharacterized MnhB-related membrane protein
MKWFRDIVDALNSINSQVIAVIVLLIGCTMVVVCKRNGIDPTIAGGVIGVASNMLTNMFTKHNESNGKSTTETTIPT